MYICVYLGRVHVYMCVYLGARCIHTYCLFCVPLSRASRAGEYPSPWLQSLLSGGAENSWGVGGGGACCGDLSELPLPEEEGSQFSWSPLSVVGLSLEKFPPVFHPQKGSFPPATCGSEGHMEGKLRTQMDAASSPWGCCSPRGRASFLGRTSWLVPGNGLRVPPSATPWGLGEAQGLLGSLLPARLFCVLANLLPIRWGPCVCPLCPLPCWQLG